jgi:hypothetical protein
MNESHTLERIRFLLELPIAEEGSPDMSEHSRCLLDFDKVWRIEDERSTIVLFIEKIGELEEMKVISEDEAIKLCILGIHYREVECERWRNNLKERYHVHGLYAAYLLASIISSYHEALSSLDIASKDLATGIEPLEQSDLSYIYFSIIGATLLHDLGGVRTTGGSATIDQKIIVQFLDGYPYNQNFGETTIARLSGSDKRGILFLLPYTDYNDSENSAFFSTEGGVRFVPERISIAGLLLICADLLQIGALDYIERAVKDLSLSTDRRPPALLLLTARALKTLAERLNIKNVLEVLPESVRERTRGILLERDKYVEVPVHDIESGYTWKTSREVYEEIKDLLGVKE